MLLSISLIFEQDGISSDINSIQVVFRKITFFCMYNKKLRKLKAQYLKKKKRILATIFTRSLNKNCHIPLSQMKKHEIQLLKYQIVKYNNKNFLGITLTSSTLFMASFQAFCLIISNPYSNESFISSNNLNKPKL